MPRKKYRAIAIIRERSAKLPSWMREETRKRPLKPKELPGFLSDLQAAFAPALITEAFVQLEHKIKQGENSAIDKAFELYRLTSRGSQPPVIANIIQNSQYTDAGGGRREEYSIEGILRKAQREKLGQAAEAQENSGSGADTEPQIIDLIKAG